ncbi:MAG: aa3-type cytochrome c oxidase subunit IV [Alphaproteobacteria bacterium]
MTENATNEEFVPGEMDISEHERTYAGFMTLSKWGTGAVIALLVIMAATLL